MGSQTVEASAFILEMSQRCYYLALKRKVNQTGRSLRRVRR